MPAERPPLAPALRELDDALAERGMPAAARNRVQARLEQEARRRAAVSGFRLRWLPALTFAAGAALVLLVVGLRFSGGDPVADAMASRVMGMFTVQGGGCRHRVEASDTVLDGTCRLVAPIMTAHTWDRVRLRDDEGTVRLREGTAMFDVTHVEAGDPPTRIHVSHGTIEVLGTRFTIEQSPRGGHVDLFEGRIRFVGLDGSSTEIAPGQRYTWGETVAALTLTPPPVAADAGPELEVAEVAAEPVEAVGPARAAEPVEDAEVEAPRSRSAAPRRRSSRDDADAGSRAPTGSADEAAAIIEEVTRLRAQRRYAEAAGVLRRAERGRRWDRRTAQVLSYELGDIIERHLGDRAAACAHWARHTERFGGGRYARAVAAAQARLGCEAAP